MTRRAGPTESSRDRSPYKSAAVKYPSSSRLSKGWQCYVSQGRLLRVEAVRNGCQESTTLLSFSASPADDHGVTVLDQRTRRILEADASDVVCRVEISRGDPTTKSGSANEMSQLVDVGPPIAWPRCRPACWRAGRTGCGTERSSSRARKGFLCSRAKRSPDRNGHCWRIHPGSLGPGLVPRWACYPRRPPAC